jgi:hypothetical protein
VLAAQTMADDRGGAKTSVLPMGSLYEGCLFVLFEIMVLKLKDLLKIDTEACGRVILILSAFSGGNMGTRCGGSPLGHDGGRDVMGTKKQQNQQRRLRRGKECGKVKPPRINN